MAATTSATKSGVHFTQETAGIPITGVVDIGHLDNVKRKTQFDAKIPYPASGHPYMTSIYGADILVGLKDDTRVSLGMKESNDIMVFACLNGLPLGREEEKVLTVGDEVPSDIKDLRILSRIYFAGRSGGVYDGSELGMTTASGNADLQVLAAGYGNIICRVPVPMSSFTPVCLGLPKKMPGQSDMIIQGQIDRVCPILVPVDKSTVSDYSIWCLQYWSMHANNAKLHSGSTFTNTNLSFFEMKNRTTKSDALVSDEVNIGHRIALGLVGTQIKFLYELLNAGHLKVLSGALKFTLDPSTADVTEGKKVANEIIEQFSEMIGLRADDNGSISPHFENGLNLLNSVLSTKKKEGQDNINDLHLDNIASNAFYTLFSTVGDVALKKARSIGTVVTVGDHADDGTDRRIVHGYFSSVGK